MRRGALRWVGIGIVALGLGAVGFDRLRGPTGTITIAARLGETARQERRGPGDAALPTLRLADPFRAVLALDRPIGSDARVDFVLYVLDEGGQDRQVMMYTVPTERVRDEIYVAWPRVERLVGGRPGRYAVRFVQEGHLLGDQRFVVTP